MAVESFINSASGELLCADRTQALEEIAKLIDDLTDDNRIRVDIRQYNRTGIELSYSFNDWAKR